MTNVRVDAHPPRRARRLTATLAGMVLCLAATACDRGREDSPPGVPDSTAMLPDTSAGADPPIEEVRMARAALASAGVPLYPGASGLDATEFEANRAPFIAVDFFTPDSMERVVEFYDRELKEMTARRDTTVEVGAVRYEFGRFFFSGLVVRPWDPTGADSTGFMARFDRRDAQGVTSADLEAYSRMLREARTHIVVNLPRPERPAET